MRRRSAVRPRPGGTSQDLAGTRPQAAHGEAADRLAIRAEIERRAEGHRLTPAHRRIAQSLIERSSEVGFLSSIELAQIANVSQPSVTRFAAALGFDGFLDMRRHLRVNGRTAPTGESDAERNRYQAAALAEAKNVDELSAALADTTLIRAFGQTLAGSRPLPVVGLRASAGMAVQFHYFASKIHPDVRLIMGGGSIIEDEIEQAAAAGASCLLGFLMPLYPAESMRALRFAKQLGLRIAVVSDTTFDVNPQIVDLVLAGRINSSLVFDSYASVTLLISVLLDAVCEALGGEAQRRLDAVDQSSKRRRVFAR
jgi:DNA-binding MurR/RpiR family transcriptional regulator